VNFIKKTFLAALVLMLAAGCSGTKTATPAASAATAEPTGDLTAQPTQVESTPTIDLAQAAQNLRGVKLTFLHPWMGKMNDAINELVEQFNQSNEWGIVVSAQAAGSASEVENTLIADLQEGTLPELVAAPVDELLGLNKNSQTVVDLTTFVESKDWGLSNAYLPVFWDQDVKAGVRLGVPAQRNAKVLVYNQTWAQELGFTQPPQTPDDFLTQTCAANAALKKDNDSQNDGLGGYIIDTDALTMASWAVAFNSDLSTFNNQHTIAAFNYLRGLLDKGCAWNSKDPSPYAYFAARQTLVYSADLQDLLKQQQAMGSAGNNDTWTVLAFPTANQPRLLTEGASYAILTSTPEKELASWLFIRYMSSLDAQGKLVKASVTLPLSDDAIPYAVELQDSLPQWVDVVNLLPDATTVPTRTDWNQAKMIWEDASWQLFKANLTAEQIPDLVKQMDETLKELTGNPQ